MLEKELVQRQETINSLKQHETEAVERETHQRIVESHKLQLELARVNAQLDDQRSAFTELQRKHDEPLQSEILPDRAQSQTQTTNVKWPESVEETISNPTPAPTVSPRRQQSAVTDSYSSTTNAVASISQLSASIGLTTYAVQSEPPAASTSRLSASTSVKPEIKEEAEDFTVVESMLPLNYLTPLPEGRRKELDAFPEFIPDVDESEKFTRGFLSAHLGGSHQPLIVKIGGSRKPLAEEHDIKKFLCPNLNQNPWCPRSPGKHGYMFVGLGNESDTFREPEHLNLFLSVPPPPKSGNALEVTYLGLYEATRVSGLTAAEWQMLSPDVRRNYAETTAHRRGEYKAENKSKLLPLIQAEYASGVLSVPCVRLRAIGFDEALYAGLLAANSGGKKRDRAMSNSDIPDPKRRRTTM
ncbi:hypothetical protein C8R47DRAFT_1106051 [Mycena vitilis]|nr:hypothetical protein C8R47DRAFT_1106051 [Mycena vitilis]